MFKSMCGCDMILFHCDLVQLLEKSLLSQGHFQVLLESCTIFENQLSSRLAQKLLQFIVVLLFQDIEMFKSNWSYFEVNVFVKWLYFTLTWYNFWKSHCFLKVTSRSNSVLTLISRY